ncbi:MAG: cache domain-containing protein, partial [Leptolyngbyaceae bacterium]|nr:cache domain-containing protein [Leptolyngbyaceae bacterium]
MLDRTPKLLTFRKVLIIPFVGQVLLVTTLVTYWSLQSGKRAIHNLVLDLSQQTSAEITQHLNYYLANARKLSEINAQILSQNVVDPNDLDAVGRFLWLQAQRYNIGYLLWGQVNGHYVDVGQPETLELDLITEQINPPRFGDRRLHTFSIDPQGNPWERLSDPIDYPFQSEAWYEQSVRTQQANWTPVYSWQSPSANPLAIAFSSPVFDQEGNLIGAIAAEQRLWQVEEFLTHLSQRDATITFIMEPNGALLARSHLDPVLPTPTHPPPQEMSQLLVEHTTHYVQTHLGGWHTIAAAQDF